LATAVDRRYRVIIWRVDFAFEGVRDAEHYAATKAGSIHGAPARNQGSSPQAQDGSFLIIYENVPPAKAMGSGRTVFDLLMSKAGQRQGGRTDDLGVPASGPERGSEVAGVAEVKSECRLVIRC
jgi:hypothetical protein